MIYSVYPPLVIYSFSFSFPDKEQRLCRQRCGSAVFLPLIFVSYKASPLYIGASDTKPEQ